jgi:hypothetical protein
MSEINRSTRMPTGNVYPEVVRHLVNIPISRAPGAARWPER